MPTIELRKHLASARHTVHYNGVPALLLKIAETIVEPFGQLGLESLCKKDLTNPLTDVEARADLTITTATASDVEEIAAMVAAWWGATDDVGPYTKLGFEGTIRDRLARGQKCFVGKVGSQIVHYNWIAFDPEETIAGTGRWIVMEDDEALCHDGQTLEPWRGKGIHTAVHNAMLHHLKDSGYRNAYTVVGALDRSANKTHHRLDWQFTGIMAYFISRRTGKARVWRLKGTLDPFGNRRGPTQVPATGGS